MQLADRKMQQVNCGGRRKKRSCECAGKLGRNMFETGWASLSTLCGNSVLIRGSEETEVSYQKPIEDVQWPTLSYTCMKLTNIK